MKSGPLILPATAACLLALAGCSSKPENAAPPGADLRSVEGERLPIGRGQTVALVFYLLTRADQARDAKFPGGPSRPVPGRTLADPQAALVQVLDVNDKIPQMFAKRIEKQLAPRLKKERERLAAEIAAAGFGKAEKQARRSLFYAVDMDGNLPRQLGLKYGRDGAATAVLDGSGRVVFARAGSVDSAELVALMGRAREGRLAPVAPALPHGAGPEPAVVLRQRGAQPPAPAPAQPQTQPSAPIAGSPAPDAPPPPAPASQSPPPPPPPPSKVRDNDRALLISLVSEGRPVVFTGHKAVFQPADPPKTAARPGPFEDAAIETEVRGRFAANPGLAGRNLTVRSRGGSVEIGGRLDDIGIAAAAINAALATPGVLEVSAEIK